MDHGAETRRRPWSRLHGFHIAAGREAEAEVMYRRPLQPPPLWLAATIGAVIVFGAGWALWLWAVG